MTPNRTDRFLRLPEVLAMTALSRATLYRKVQCGTFPRQIKLNLRCAAWRESDIMEWFENPTFYSAENVAA